jgi:ribosomal protein L6P/L9E
MSNLARVNIYTPEFFFFEMQQFRQNYVCWLSGPYNTRKVKFSNHQPLDIWRNKLRFKTSFVEIGSRFYETTSNRNLQRIHQKTSLLHIYMKHWIVGTLVGFQNALRVRGVGYRFDISPLKITIQAGYSHLVFRKIPSISSLQTLILNKKATLLKIKSSDITMLHTFLSSIRNLRHPDVYKGKGIRYQKDFIFRKEGKKKKTS